MQNAVPVDPVDGILERNGYCISAGVRRYNQPYWHIHRGIEILFVHSGTADFYAGKQHYSLTAGELLVAHVEMNHGAGGDFNRSVIHFVPDILPIEARHKMSRLLEEGQYLQVAVEKSSASRLNWAIEELRHFNMQYQNYALVKALMGLITVEIETSVKEPNNAVHPYQLQQVVNYMKANIASDEKLECLADRFEVSTRHLYNLFNDRFGCSPRQYWMSLKLEYACCLLQSTQSINDIASAVGFQSLRGFQRAFLRAYQITPSSYRTKVDYQALHKQ